MYRQFCKDNTRLHVGSDEWWAERKLYRCCCDSCNEWERLHKSTNPRIDADKLSEITMDVALVLEKYGLDGYQYNECLNVLRSRLQESFDFNGLNFDPMLCPTNWIELRKKREEVKVVSPSNPLPPLPHIPTKEQKNIAFAKLVGRWNKVTLSGTWGTRYTTVLIQRGQNDWFAVYSGPQQGFDSNYNYKLVIGACNEEVTKVEVAFYEDERLKFQEYLSFGEDRIDGHLMGDDGKKVTYTKAT